MNNYWLLIFILFSCANPIPPTGGPKDLDPPILLNTVPENKTLNFTGTEISMDFDEYIKEENLLTQLLITPNLEGNYTFKVNKNRIVLNFEQPFDSTTTYTLNFREGIKDITEGNVPPNLKFVFSTGDFLDSASIRGVVRSLMTKKILEDITVSLYQFPDTVTIFDAPPRYSTITDDQGKFVLENIKNGTYTVYSLNDENRNLTLESRNEGYGYLGEPLVINDSLSAIELFIFKLDTRPIVLQSSRPIGHNFDVKFNKALAGYQINTENHNLESNLVEENQTLRFYRNDAVTDSLGIQFTVMDSLQQSIDTLVYVKFLESTRRPEDFNAVVLPRNGEVNKQWNGTIELNKPATTINYDSIYFRFDSLYMIPLNDSNFVVNYSRDQYRLNFDFKQYLPDDSIFSNWSQKFEFIIAAGSIISVENDSIERIRRELLFKNPKDYGILRGTITTDYPSYFLQLIDKSYDVVKQLAVNSTGPFNYEFNHTKPGTYSIRVLVDENQSGTWDPGNIQSIIPPEKVLLFFHPNTGTKEINLRANWEQSGLDINF